ncbi:MAG: LOG family protein [Candidatus Protochlamydia sp.]|nr:LOG family protein [Candidatus Protochlamydia sp.]
MLDENEDELKKSDFREPYKLDPFQEELRIKIFDLIAFNGGNILSVHSDLICQIITASLKMGNETYDLGQLKLMTRAFKEMRYAYRIFNKYPVAKRISIFGSSRTPPEHPDYLAAKKFSASMANTGWVCITGAADGIMRAGLEGAEKESRFGLSIRLPFETPSNSLLAGDPKLITFRYFFTRKLMFLSHSDAIAAFPGGVGTQDELFEVLTLMQTGKANIIPVVLLEGDGGSYWSAWQNYLRENLLKNGWISEDDQYLYFLSPTIEEAVAHIHQFYSRYHSSRYVKDTLIIRLLSPITAEQAKILSCEFAPLLKEGEIYLTDPLPEETDHLELPRLAFEHNHKHFGLLRKLIDRLNSL